MTTYLSAIVSMALFCTFLDLHVKTL